MEDREPDGGVDGPEPAADARREARRSAPVGRAGGALRRAAHDRRGGAIEWARTQPILAGSLVLFCVVAVVGLVLSLPRGLWSGRSMGGAQVATPAPPIGGRSDSTGTGSAGPPVAAAPGPAPEEPGPWMEADVPSASARGVSLVYRYRTLPAGGESRYEWIVQVRGARAVLDGIDVVNWRMEPAAKNGADFVSRDRAADGFPLFGHGPGGWFGVSATIRYQGGGEETLARRIELSE